MTVPVHQRAAKTLYLSVGETTNRQSKLSLFHGYETSEFLPASFEFCLVIPEPFRIDYFATSERIK